MHSITISQPLISACRASVLDPDSHFDASMTPKSQGKRPSPAYRRHTQSRYNTRSRNHRLPDIVQLKIFFISPIVPLSSGPLFRARIRFFVVFTENAHRPIISPAPQVDIVAPPLPQLPTNIPSQLLSLLPLPLLCHGSSTSPSCCPP